MDTPFVQGHRRPRLADVHCSKVYFNPGDRIIVETNGALDAAQQAKLRRTIEKWAGEPLEILIVDRTKMKVTVDKCQTTD